MYMFVHMDVFIHTYSHFVIIVFNNDKETTLLTEMENIFLYTFDLQISYHSSNHFSM